MCVRIIEIIGSFRFIPHEVGSLLKYSNDFNISTFIVEINGESNEIPSNNILPVFRWLKAWAHPSKDGVINLQVKI